MNEKGKNILYCISPILIALISLVAFTDTAKAQKSSLSKPKSNPDRFRTEISQLNNLPDTKAKIARLSKLLKVLPAHPDNITLQYALAVQTAKVTDPKTHQFVRTDEARRIYEKIIDTYNHTDYYRSQLPNHPRSPQIIMPECAIKAGIYQPDQQAARDSYYKAMEYLNQTWQMRKKDWLNQPAPAKPDQQSPFSGSLEVSKWLSKNFRFQQRKSLAQQGNVMHEMELSLLKTAVKRYLLTFISPLGDKNYPSYNQHKTRKALVKIRKDFPDSLIADYAFEYTDLIVNVLDKVRIKTK